MLLFPKCFHMIISFACHDNLLGCMLSYYPQFTDEEIGTWVIMLTQEYKA